MVHSEVYLNKYVVSIAPFSTLLEVFRTLTEKSSGSVLAGRWFRLFTETFLEEM